MQILDVDSASDFSLWKNPLCEQPLTQTCQNLWKERYSFRPLSFWLIDEDPEFFFLLSKEFLHMIFENGYSKLDNPFKKHPNLIFKILTVDNDSGLF